MCRQRSVIDFWLHWQDLLAISLLGSGEMAAFDRHVIFDPLL